MARLNIEPESVIAWTIFAMLIYYALEFCIRLFKDRQRFKRKIILIKNIFKIGY